MEKDHTPEIDIQQYWLVLKRRWLFLAAVFVASVGLSGLAILKQGREYQASGMLLFKSDQTSSLTKAGGKIGDLESLMHEGNPLQTQAVILNSQPIIQEVIKSLGLKDKQGHPLNSDALKIKVEPVVGTDVLKVSYTSKSPELAASIVNQLMKLYVENNIQSNRAQVTIAGEFIKKQLLSSREELERATEALRQFKIRYKVIQLPQEATAAITNITQLDDEIHKDQAALAEVSAQEEQVANQLNLEKREVIKTTSLSQIPGVQDVLGELQKAQTNLASQRAIYTESNPTIVELKNKEAILNSLLQQRIKQVSGSNLNISPSMLQMGKTRESLADQYLQLQTQHQGLEKKLQSLSKIQAAYQQRLTILPNLEKTAGDLERNVTTAQTNYQNLFTTLQEIQVAQNQTIGNARVIQPAEIPEKPVLSKITLLLAGGGVFVGLLLGVGAAFFVDLIDNSLKTVKETETFFGYTLLGLIPKFEFKSESGFVKLMGDGVSGRVIVASSPRTVIHEAYQALQANLNFISDKKVRTIAITSSVPNEGKSEVCANLAAVLAQAGRRVLLVDADMRQPVQHHIWGLINSVGLTHLIVGQREFPKAVQKVTKYLSVLTTGAIPPNPPALLDSERMTSLIEQFSQTYDYILFDTPPLVGTVDAAILGKMVDGVLLVARLPVANTANAKAAKSLLERSGANILGFVANAIDVKQEPDNYFYYSISQGEQSFTEADIAEELWAHK